MALGNNINKDSLIPGGDSTNGRSKSECEQLRVAAQQFMPMLELNVDGIIQSANLLFEQLTGYTTEELKGKAERVLHPTPFYQNGHQDSAWEIVNKGDTYFGKVTLQTKGGQERPVEVSLVPIKDESGKPEKVFMLVKGERMTTVQNDSQRDDETLQKIMDNVPAVVYRSHLNENGQPQFTHLSRHAEQLFGYTAKEILSSRQYLSTVVHPDDFPDLQKEIQDAVKTRRGIDYEFRIRTKEGQEKWVRLEAEQTGSSENYESFGFIRDVTERRLTQDRIVKSEAKLYESQKIAQLGTFDWDVVSDAVVWNDVLFEMWSVPKDETLSLASYIRRIHPEDVEEVQEVLQKSMESPKATIYEVNHRAITDNGEVRFVEVVGKIIRDKTGSPTQIIGTVKDFTENKEKEREIARLNAYQNAIIENAGFAIIVTAPEDGTILVFNKQAERDLGYKAEELVNKKSPAILHIEEEVLAHTNRINEEFDAGITPSVDTFHYKSRVTGLPDINEWTYVRKDGSKYPVQLAVNAVQNEEGEIIAYLGISEDITERKRNEDRLQTQTDVLNKLITDEDIQSGNKDITFQKIT
ncbi:MAG: PAS domain S-box protein, partial [Bacteroidota bacterium]